MSPQQDVSLAVAFSGDTDCYSSRSTGTSQVLKYILIPADLGKPIEELTHTGVCELSNDSWMTHLKAYFGGINADGVDKKLLKQQLQQHAGEAAMAKVDDKLMQQLIMMSSVDIFPTLLPIKQSNFMGVSVYVDDKGIAKGLPVNQRLSTFVQEVGYADQIFSGDGFMARVQDSETDDIWRRLDFTMADMSSSAEWVGKAREQLKNRRSPQEVADFKKQFTQNPVQVEDGGNKHQPDREGTAATYTFRDGTEECELLFNKEVTDKKKVLVTYPTHDSLSVTYDGENLLGENLLGARKLFAAVVRDECAWTILDKKLQLTLMKKHPAKWAKILADE